MIDLQLLRYFVAVVEHGSVTAAADELAITQPALSRRIKALESALGSTLFERTARGHRLTAAGLRVLPIARGLIDQANHAEEEIESRLTGRELRFRVVCPEATVRNVIAPFIAETGARIGSTVIRVAAQIYDTLDDPEIDFAVNTLPPPVALASLLLARGSLNVEFLPSHPLARRATIEVADLIGERIIVIAKGSGLRAVVEAVLLPVRDRVTIVAEPESTDMAQAIAATGAGVCIELAPPVFGLVARPLVDAGRRIQVPVYAAWNTSHFAAEEIRLLAHELATWTTVRGAKLDRGTVR